MFAAILNRAVDKRFRRAYKVGNTRLAAARARRWKDDQ
jgi:hypothetical protein